MRSCSTSCPSGNQVDGLPLVVSSSSSSSSWGGAATRARNSEGKHKLPCQINWECFQPHPKNTLAENSFTQPTTKDRIASFGDHVHELTFVLHTYKFSRRNWNAWRCRREQELRTQYQHPRRELQKTLLLLKPWCCMTRCTLLPKAANTYKHATGPVAQWIRHRPTEPGIAGSSPAGVILFFLQRDINCYMG